jgi:penicillin-insensitive murein endopeptidase
VLRSLSRTSVALLAVVASGCVHRGFFTDGTSVSYGRADRGLLRSGVELPPEGSGYVVPGVWRDRGTQFGTAELITAIQRAARAVEERLPGGILGVGDLSRRGGGRMQFHKSHENGRDADLIFYAVDEDGQPVAPTSAMPRYDRRLRSRAPYERSPVAVSPRHFDLARNWALITALLDDATIDVEYLFVSERLREHLIDYARAAGERPEVIARAARALRQPRRALPHDDHLHLRIRCAPSDLSQGCVDEGPVRVRLLERWRPPVT